MFQIVMVTLWLSTTPLDASQKLERESVSIWLPEVYKTLEECTTAKNSVVYTGIKKESTKQRFLICEHAINIVHENKEVDAYE
jgi:hypothetical protein